MKEQSREAGPGFDKQSRASSNQQLQDLFDKLFTEFPLQPATTSTSGHAGSSTVASARLATPGGVAGRPSGGGVVPRPKAPRSLLEAGLPTSLVAALTLKLLYVHGHLYGYDFARLLRLPYALLDETLQYLTQEKLFEVTTGEVMGRVTYRFQLTDLGRQRAREAMDQSQYVGPAPVSLSDYVAYCRLQNVAAVPCTLHTLNAAFEQMVLQPSLLAELGPAVCSGKSIFLFGPPGNGKTMIAKGLGNYLNRFGGEIFVPYAIHVSGSIVTMFDPTIHQVTDQVEQTTESNSVSKSSVGTPNVYEESDYDRRWRRIRRPVIMTGGELTLEMLELRYESISKFYQAPLHIKANGGVFLIDDFGRQLVSPKELLNRWILPLEERVDYLSLATGEKFAVPFEQLIIFSTNLDPQSLVDEAFLRRIRHKISIQPPSRDVFGQIWGLLCRKHQVAVEPEVVDYLFETIYDQGRIPRSSDPRDLLEIGNAICRFNSQEFRASLPIIQQAASQFFPRLN